MTISDLLSIGYKKYKDENIEIKNGYSLSFEDLRIDIDSNEEDRDREYIQLEAADICDLSDDWTPVGKINKKNKKTFPEKLFRYVMFIMCISIIIYLCYSSLIDVYRE
jgi:hypothetical protein